jgi:hypothetical protein
VEDSIQTHTERERERERERKRERTRDSCSDTCDPDNMFTMVRWNLNLGYEDVMRHIYIMNLASNMAYSKFKEGRKRKGPLHLGRSLTNWLLRKRHLASKTWEAEKRKGSKKRKREGVK